MSFDVNAVKLAYALGCQQALYSEFIKMNGVLFKDNSPSDMCLYVLAKLDEIAKDQPDLSQKCWTWQHNAGYSGQSVLVEKYRQRFENDIRYFPKSINAEKKAQLEGIKKLQEAVRNFKSVENYDDLESEILYLQNAIPESWSHNKYIKEDALENLSLCHRELNKKYHNLSLARLGNALDSLIMLANSNASVTEIQKQFALLSLDMRTAIFKKLGVFPESQNENYQQLFSIPQEQGHPLDRLNQIIPGTFEEYVQNRRLAKESLNAALSQFEDLKLQEPRQLLPILAEILEVENFASRLAEMQKAKEDAKQVVVSVDPWLQEGTLFIRGDGPGMDWEKGVELKLHEGQFVFKLPPDFGCFEFKLLLDDKKWCEGANFKVQEGEVFTLNPNTLAFTA